MRSKGTNAATILRLMQEYGPISRARLARQIGTSPTTIGSVVGKLLKRAYVIEGPSGSSNGGRPPVLLELNRNRFVMGVEVSATDISVIVASLSGTKVAHTSVPTHGAKGYRLIEHLLEVLARARDLTQASALTGIGVATPGLVDDEAGIVRSADAIEWSDVPLRAIVEERFRLPTHVENNANAAVVGEGRYGAARGARNLLYVNLGVGVGAGLVIDGSLYRGSSKMAGELGHLVVDPDGPRCHCGRYGCLEALVGTDALTARARDSAVAAGGPSGEPVDLDTIARALAAGDSGAVALCENAGVWIGTALAGVINLMNPELIILGGPTTRLGPRLLDAVRQTLERRTLALPLAGVKIVAPALRSDSAAMGAAVLALDSAWMAEEQT